MIRWLGIDVGASDSKTARSGRISRRAARCMWSAGPATITGSIVSPCSRSIWRAPIRWLIIGSDAPRVSLDDYAERLRPAAMRRLPALCANPDLLMLTESGQQPAPGAIARLYETLGGRVVYVGKPHAFIYAIASRGLAGVEPRRILALGDSPAHDVAGAAQAGFATALVKTGLSAGRDDDELRRAAPSAPDFVLDGL